MPSRPDLPAQTALRGLAAFTVFIAHAHFDWLFPQFPHLGRAYQIFSWQANGVDLFFELSGFILCYVYLFTDFRWKDYALARFARIYPVYLLTLLFFLSLNLLAYLKTGTFTSETTPQIVISNLLLIQDWPPFSEIYSLNEPTWSISIEVFLYIYLFPTLCLLQKRLAEKTKMALAILPIVLLCALYGLDAYFQAPVVPFLKGPVRGICCFSSGFFLCSVGLVRGFRTMPRTFEIALLLVAVGSLLFEFPLPHSCADLTFPFLVYFTADLGSLTSRMLGFPLLCWLGDLSYSIYVWHWPLIKALGVLLGMRTLGHSQLRHDSVGRSLLYAITLVGLTLVVSHLSHYYFEMPVGRWLRRIGKKRPAHVEAAAKP